MDTAEDIKKKLGVRKVAIPIIIGLLAASWVLYSSITSVYFEKSDLGNYELIETTKDFDAQDESLFKEVAPRTGSYKKITYRETLNNLDWTYLTTFWIILAIICVAIRLFGYVLRLRILTDKKLSWRKCLDVILLWEFASALTPSVVGGAGFAIYFLYKEGISAGKSTGIVMVTALLDELFYILMVPLILLFVASETIFPVGWEGELIGIPLSTEGFFWAGYVFICVLTTTIIFGIFIAPRTVKYILINVFNLPILRKWRYSMIRWGDDLITTSEELKDKSLKFWSQAFGATLASWTARYLVVNCLIAAFVLVNDHFLIYAKQLVMWIIMLMSPTPGSSGLAELVFTEFFSDIVPTQLAGPLSVIWRMLTYFLYIFLGVIILPRWLRRVSQDKRA